MIIKICIKKGIEMMMNNSVKIIISDYQFFFNENKYYMCAYVIYNYISCVKYINDINDINKNCDSVNVEEEGI